MNLHCTYYTVLGVPADVPPEGIKAAFRRLAKRHHPDTATADDGGLDFRLVREAYEILSDPESRKQYDALLAAAGVSAESSVPAMGARTAGDTVLESVQSGCNFILWEIEDLLNGRALPSGVPDVRVHPWIMPVLRFFDRWVLEAAGYPDYFYEARHIRVSRYHHETIGAPDRNRHRPYVSIRDFFLQIRKRMDRLIENIDRNALRAGVAPGGLSLLECVLEGNRLAFHYLGGIRKVLRGESGGVPAYRFTHPVFEGVSGHIGG